MSGAASLAAAKRRRNPAEMLGQQHQPQAAQQRLSGVRPDGTKTNRPINPEMHPAQVLRLHDRQIFVLERSIEALAERLPGEGGEGSGTSGNPELESLVLNSNAEMKILKNTISKQQKSIQELTSLVTSLRGKVNSQDADISALSENLTSNLTMEPEKNKLKLDISEGK